jgi:hypothetical protein
MKIAIILDREPHNLLDKYELSFAYTCAAFIFREMKVAGGQKQFSLKCQNLPTILYGVTSHKPVFVRARRFTCINVSYSHCMIKD